MAKALVIGANGFIGSHLTDALVRLGHDVTAFDRFSSGRVTFTSHPQVIAGDFLNRTDVESALQGRDLVFHFLSTTTPASAGGDPTLDLRTNVATTVELLEASVRAGVGHVYFASTGGAIYGSHGLTRYSETVIPEPVSPYAIGKLAIENYLRYFEMVHGLQSTSLRISNPYGTRQHPGKRQGLIPIALRQIARGEPVVQFGDGSMVRDYLFVEDLVSMIERLVRVGADRKHRVYNIGSGIGASVLEVFDVLRDVTGVDFTVDQREVPPTFTDRIVLDVSRFSDEFGSTPLTSLHDGVLKTYQETVRASDG